jgi:hypothetical protein
MQFFQASGRASNVKENTQRLTLGKDCAIDGAVPGLGDAGDRYFGTG